MTTDALHAAFSWGFLSDLASASTAVIAIANTLGLLVASGKLGRLKLSRLWAAFIAAEILSFYAAWHGDWSWEIAPLIEVVFFGGILFCFAAGLHQSVLAIARRLAVKGVAASNGWWDSWF